MRIFILILVTHISFSQMSYSDSLEIKAKKLNLKKLDNNAYQIGEELDFVVYLTFIINWKAGYTKMKVLDTVYFHGRPAYHIKWTTKSTNMIAHFYSIRDTIETFIDMEYGFSWGYKKRTREGDYNRDLIVTYDHLYDRAKVEVIRYEGDNLNKIKKEKEFYSDIVPFTNDIVSSFYTMRTSGLDLEGNLKIQNHSKRLNYLLEVEVMEKEGVEVEAGKFRTYKIRPRIKGESIISSDNDLIVYVTQDSRHIPVKMTTEMPIGSINVELYRKRNVMKEDGSSSSE